MKRFLSIMIILTAWSSMLSAQSPESLDQAKAISARQNKPILIEFYRVDCPYCQTAAKDVAANDSIKALIISTVFCMIDVKTTEGERLITPYHIGNTFPVFVLTDSSGGVINRWTGYTGARPFIQSLKKSLSNLETINQRYDRLANLPSLDNALFLAGYNYEIGENAKAVEFYNQAQTLQTNKSVGYSYEIFQNTGDAVWKGTMKFSQLISAADKVLKTKSKDANAITNVARTMTMVARKVGRTADIARYLQAGIDITNAASDNMSKERHAIYLADQALYIEKDTTKAINLRKTSLGPEWQKNPEKYFGFSKWCLERNINLIEAENYARQAVDRASAGKLRATVLNTLSGIYEAQGNLNDATKTMELASEQDSTNESYTAELERLLNKLKNKNKSAK